jgi:hypothetical protein
MTDDYWIVLGDVIASKDVDGRAAFRSELDAALEEINAVHADAVHAPFTVLKGIDEVGGVLDSVAPVAEIQRTLARRLHPESIRLAVVSGEIDVNADADDVTRMDGEAFARADDLLAELADDGRTFALSGSNDALDVAVSDEIDLLELIRSEWTERQNEVVAEYERLGSQTAVAAELGVSDQAVSDHLRRANADRILEIENRLSKLLNNY